MKPSDEKYLTETMERLRLLFPEWGFVLGVAMPPDADLATWSTWGYTNIEGRGLYDAVLTRLATAEQQTIRRTDRQ